MKFSSKTVLLIGLSATCLFAKDPLVLLRTNRFLEAIQEWDLQMADGGEKKIRALKGQALAYSRLGELYEVFHEFNQDLSKSYYQAVVKNNSSTKIWLYLGQIDYYNGNYADAQKKLERVISTTEDAQSRELAEVFRHYSLVKMGKKSGSFTANARIPLAVWQSNELSGIDKIPERIPESGARSIRCKLSILLRDSRASQADIEQTLNLLLALSDDPESYLDKGQLTQINFFDPMLLKTISNAFFRMSVYKNQQVKDSEKDFPQLASKFETHLALAESLIPLGQFSEAKSAIGSDDSEKARLIRAKLALAMGNTKETKSIVSSLIKSDNPQIVREAGYMYHLAGIDSKKSLKVIGDVIGNSKNSMNFRRYGKVLLDIKKYQPSLEAFAKGYKIQYRNDIEQNDPEYMTEYAQAIFTSSKMRYEEVVETLFHIQKAYPACRQMHYFMQGLAAAEARNFGTTDNIIRRG